MKKFVGWYLALGILGLFVQAILGTSGSDSNVSPQNDSPNVEVPATQKARSICYDQTIFLSSNDNRHLCNGHGGVAYFEWVDVNSQYVNPTYIPPSNSGGYTVTCNDGTISNSGGIQGACSHHGGVSG